MDIWACNCPLCRVLVHPILRLFISSQEMGHGEPPPRQQAGVGEGEEGVEKLDSIEHSKTDIGGKNRLSEDSRAWKREVEKEEREEGENKQQDENMVRQSGRGWQEQSMPSIVELAQPQEQPRQEEVKPAIPEEVRKKIEKLENELGKLRNELKEALESITEALIDVRAAVVENVNPFFATDGGRQLAPVFGAGIDVEHLVELIRMLNEELDKFNLDTLVELIDGLAESGSISEASARTLKALVKAVSKMREKGVSVDKQIRLITLLLNKQVKSKS